MPIWEVDATCGRLYRVLEQLQPAMADAAAGAANPANALGGQGGADKRLRVKSRGSLLIGWEAFTGFLNKPYIQCCIYFVFVYIFQMLVTTTRLNSEFYLDKHVMDRIVEAPFDSSHNTFNSIRRVADIYEWGNTVLMPGLMGDLGPCEIVGSVVNGYSKGCNDDVWPDGDGAFHLGDRLTAGDGPTPYTVEEQVMRMDQLDWSEGILIRQGRADPESCRDTDQLGECLPELLPGEGSHAPFGYNYTHPAELPSRQFTHMSAAELGGSPDGIRSTSLSTSFSGRYDADGYVALAIPFFSDTWLQPEEGLAAEVADFRRYSVSTTNGRVALFYCVRTSINGLWMRQSCDPGTLGNGTGALTGLVRREVEVWWNELKRAHYIDMHTRVMTITLQLKSNHEGVRCRINLLFELSALGAIFTSFDVDTRVLRKDLILEMAWYANIGLGMVVFFCVIALVEVVVLGPIQYFGNMWNVIDWTNYILFYLVWFSIRAYNAALVETPEYGGKACESYLCSQVGYWDDWRVMRDSSDTKFWLSLCVCLQLLKMIKHIELLVPKVSLATSVLRYALVDLLFFSIAFLISMFSFSMLFYVSLGPCMSQFMSIEASFLTITRSLFGDSDIGAILDNSKNYLSAFFYLGYLFVAIFIMLSMFIVILADSQLKMLDRKRKLSEAEVLDQDGWPDEYGALAYVSESVRGWFGCTQEPTKEPERKAAPAEDKAEGALVETLMASQLELINEVKALRTELSTLKEKSVLVNFAPPIMEYGRVRGDVGMDGRTDGRAEEYGRGRVDGGMDGRGRADGGRDEPQKVYRPAPSSEAPPLSARPPLSAGPPLSARGTSSPWAGSSGSRQIPPPPAPPPPPGPPPLRSPGLAAGAQQTRYGI